MKKSDINQNIPYNWDICGHEKIVSFLSTGLKNNHLGHAYIFWGVSSLGKLAVADKFIKSLFCDGDDGHKAGDNCFSCRQIENGLHPDVYRVARANDEKTGKLKRDLIIDQMRDLKSKLQQGTLLNGYKVAVISEAHLINNKAANSLLKLLEEPTPKTIVILLADNIEDIPATIISRCQVIKFLPVPSETIDNYLIEKGYNQDIAKVASRLAVGRPGLAINWSHQDQSLADYQQKTELFLRLMSADLTQRLSLVDELISWDKDESININRVKELLDCWSLAIRDCLLVGRGNDYLTSNFDLLDKIRPLSANSSFSRLKKIISQMKQLKIFLDDNLSSRNLLENLIINL
ncbi:MAG: DNA polymerase III subunit delta' [Patescibacteria group bacterium]